MAAQPTPAHPAIMQAQLESIQGTPESGIPEPIVTTQRLIIRPMHPQDSHSTAQHANNPNVSKYMSLAFPSPYTLDSANTWINMNLVKPRQDDFVICEKQSPERVIGGIGLKPGADVMAHTAEIGFWIGESHWGKGFTTEALAAMTEWVFKEREVDGIKTTRLWGGVFSGNEGSMRCFAKCGYPPEGVLKGHVVKHGQIYDLHQFGMTKADWEARMS